MTDQNATSVDLRKMANAIRALSMDAVQKANSGHPGMPMGMADVATVLFSKFLKFDPENPDWPDRDRFVLSAGHGSMLLYSLLHLTGYAHPTMDEIKAFRQLGQPCAGHPEYGLIKGIETTTGPLGQGLATAVGMAMAEAHLSARFGKDLVDHKTYVIAGDGCLMEGVSQEAISLAGHLKLNKLIVLWDDNHISIDGPTSLSTSEDHIKRFEAAGWITASIDGHDHKAIEKVISDAQDNDRPTLIACRTIIGFGAPNKQGSESTHGAPLGEEEIAAARKTLNWPYDPFDIPEDIRAAWMAVGKKGGPLLREWETRLEKNKLGNLFKDHFSEASLPILKDAIRDYKKLLAKEPQKVATRKASQLALDIVNEVLPNTIGGSADLTGSNNTKTGDMKPLTRDHMDGRYVYYGIREFGMSATMNGMALHGGVLPYGGTFLVFSDYARPAMRLSALMNQRVIYVMTHDSIGLGEDGPTHQPIEHLASLRAMPNMSVFRPADIVETAECWQLAVEGNGPSVLALSRQGLPQVRLTHTDENLCAKGGYILDDCDGDNPDITLVATGSEVSLALEAKKMLADQGHATRVVSMPNLGLFITQSLGYREATLGTGLKVSIEAGAGQGWREVVGDKGLVFGIDRFGESAPAADIYHHLGLTAEAVANKILKTLA